MDFEPQAHSECKELAQKLLKLIPELFPKNRRLDRGQQCKQRFRWINSGLLWRFEKTFKQYSGLIPESFSNHQNDPLLNSTFLEGLDEDLTTLVKRHNLGWSALRINPLVTQADQIFKTIKKKRKGDIYKNYEPSIVPIK